MARNQAPAQSFISSYAPRLRQYGNAFLTPVLQTQAVAPGSRTTKRGTTIINYADDAFDDDDFEESDGPRRLTGLRSLRREEQTAREAAPDRPGKEIYSPVEVQGIFRDWMTRRTVKPTSVVLKRSRRVARAHMLTKCRTEQQLNVQAQLPLTLIPIRIDLDVNSFQPEAPFPMPRNLGEGPINASLPAFRRPDQAPPYKIRDVFLWNLHEALLTPDDFALTLVRELDLPNQHGLTAAISSQIRSQLEEYAGVALHPLFHSSSKSAANKQTTNGTTNGTNLSGAFRQSQSRASPAETPRPGLETFRSSRNVSMTPGASTPMPSTPLPQSNGYSTPAPAAQAEAELIPADPDEDAYLNPDDTYRCIITLSVSLSSRLYTDKFEWSLLHPPGMAEMFAKQTCADMGLPGEWVLAITHAIYEAILKLKKEACEGGLLSTGGSWGMGGELDNQAINPETQSGWRYDADDFGAEWEPKLELLSKDEIEKREGDRERQLRRLRRETARFSSTSGMQSMTPQEFRGGYFDSPAGGDGETPMGRGERSKKKRRFRSLSPVAKALGGSGDAISTTAAWGAGGSGILNESERQVFRCKWCQVWGSAVWAVRDGPGPDGNRVSSPTLLLAVKLTITQSLCQNCGLLYERDKRLPVWSKDLHRHDIQVR